MLEEFGLPVLTRRIHQRVRYPQTASTGTTVLDDAEADDEAAFEVRMLVREVLDLINVANVQLGK